LSSSSLPLSSSSLLLPSSSSSITSSSSSPDSGLSKSYRRFRYGFLSSHPPDRVLDPVSPETLITCPSGQAVAPIASNPVIPFHACRQTQIHVQRSRSCAPQRPVCGGTANKVV
jgi:hypothetical protein